MEGNSSAPRENSEQLRALRLKKLDELEQQHRSPSLSDELDKNKIENKQAMKEMEKILVFDICDEKHNSPQALLSNSIRPLMKILSNIREHPSEDKYRKLRYNNTFVQKSIVGTPSEKLLRLIGWTSATENFEKVLIFKHQQGSKEWDLVCAAIEKLKVIEKKEIERIDSVGQKHEQRKQLLENARLHIRQDEDERHARFQY